MKCQHSLVFIDGKISLASLDQWLTGEKSPLKPKPKSKGENLPKSIFDRIEQNVPKHSSKYDKELILSEKVTFGLLLKVFLTQNIEMKAEISNAKGLELKGSSKYGTPDDPNYSEIARKLIMTLDPSLKEIENAPYNYSLESTRRRISAVHDALEVYINDN